LSSESLLEVRDLHKHFGGLIAVRDATFAVKRGSITGLIGPNGAGKTTVFNIISGAARADGGTVVFDGIDISNEPPHRVCAVGLVRTFQLTRVFAQMTVLENVMLAARNHPGERFVGGFRSRGHGRRREREVARRAQELLELVCLDQSRSAYASTLSGGQRKLLELARALMAEPKMILLDEPLAGVNPALAADVLTHIFATRDAGVTLLIVEHDMDFVMTGCDHVIVMSEGHVITEGDPDTIRDDRRVVEAYLGAEWESVAV
jgi:ABC-type branched-subunit amino acid transport system ATPase component